MEHRFEREKGHRTLLLLHSTGGDENQLIEVGRMLDPDANLLSPRGQVEEDGARRFFRRLGEGVFDLDDLREKTLELAGFLEATEFEYDLDPAALFAVGYSNGANIGFSLLLGRPNLMAGAVLLRPMLPYAAQSTARLDGKQVLVLSGQADPSIPSEQVEELEKALWQRGAKVEVSWQPAGHALGTGDYAAARAWLQARP